MLSHAKNGPKVQLIRIEIIRDPPPSWTPQVKFSESHDTSWEGKICTDNKKSTEDPNAHGRKENDETGNEKHWPHIRENKGARAVPNGGASWLVVHYVRGPRRTLPTNRLTDHFLVYWSISEDRIRNPMRAAIDRAHPVSVQVSRQNASASLC